MLPLRTYDTMVEAIALSSPSGSMSKRARKQAEQRLHKALFGENPNLKGEDIPLTEKESLLFKASQNRKLAKLAGPRQAKKLIKMAEEIERAYA